MKVWRQKSIYYNLFKTIYENIIQEITSIHGEHKKKNRANTKGTVSYKTQDKFGQFRGAFSIITGQHVLGKALQLLN